MVRISASECPPAGPDTATAGAGAGDSVAGATANPFIDGVMAPGADAHTVLEVRHATHYRYAAPVTLAQHQAHLRPLEDVHQALLVHELLITPAPAHQRNSVDAFGNAQTHFSLEVAHRELEVVATSRLRVRPRFAALRAEASPAWEALAVRSRYVARAPLVPEVEFAHPSPHVPRLAPLRDWALPSFPPGRPVAEAALDLMHRLHAEFTYESQSTAVDTPLATAFAQRRGVCQDFAHLMIGALRLLGLPARYVSGYLLTTAPDSGAGMVGADASHAWLQVWCPGTPGVPEAGPGAGWLDLDPTNDLVPGAGHVRVAVGRDYSDVTPLRGVIRGCGSHLLTVAVHTRRLDADANNDTPGAGLSAPWTDAAHVGTPLAMPLTQETDRP